MLELCQIQKGAPNGWNVDVRNLLKVTAVDGRLERLEMSSHVVPRSAGVWSSRPTTAHGGISVQAGSVQNGDMSGSIGGRLEPAGTYAAWVESHERRALDDHSILARERVLIWDVRNLLDQRARRHRRVLEFLLKENCAKLFLDIPQVPLEVRNLPWVTLHGYNSLATCCARGWVGVGGNW